MFSVVFEQIKLFSSTPFKQIQNFAMRIYLVAIFLLSPVKELKCSFCVYKSRAKTMKANDSETINNPESYLKKLDQGSDCVIGFKRKYDPRLAEAT